MVICVLVLIVGVFAFFVTVDEIGYEKEQIETFNVADPSVDQTFTLDHNAESILYVEQFNGYAWIEVDASDYTQTGANKVTVDSDGMQG